MSRLQMLAHFVTVHGSSALLLGTLAAALGWMLAKVVGRDHAGTRFLVWFSSLLAIAAIFVVHPFGWSHDNSSPLIALPSRSALYLTAAWLIGATFGLARLVAGLWRVRTLRASVIELDSLGKGLSFPIPASSVFSRKVVIGTSSFVRVPTAVGFFKPAVILPTWTVNELSQEELHTVVLHELAHIGRWDDWTNLAQKVLRALLFFHPAVWWIDSRLSIEREMSCDDAVLALSGNPRKYAECLISLAEKSYLRRPMVMAQAALGHVKDTAARIAKILDGKHRRPALGWKSVVVTATSFLLLAAVGVEHTPELVGFKEPASGARVTPASFAPSTMMASPVRLAAVRTPPTAKPRHTTRPAPRATPAVIPNQPAEIASQRNDLRHTPPALVNAAEKDASEPQVLYVIFQTHRIDDSGALMITTSVWRVRVLKPSPKAMTPEVNPRST